jgi:serine/threonine protein kinase
MKYSLIGKGIDGQVYKIKESNKVYAFKVGLAQQMREEEYHHFLIYNTIKCKRAIIKPLKLSIQKCNFILESLGKDIAKYHGYAMEYVKGETLRTFLAKKSLTSSDYISVRKQINGKLRCLWSSGFVHGDTHMKNIIVTQTKGGKPRVKLFDFGFSLESNPPKCITKKCILEWFNDRWKKVLLRRNIQKGNPDSMYLKLNMLPFYANKNQNLLRYLQNIKFKNVKIY